MFYLQYLGKISLSFPIKNDILHFLVKIEDFFTIPNVIKKPLKIWEKYENSDFSLFCLRKKIFFVHFIKCICLKFMYAKGQVTNITKYGSY